MSTFTEQSVRTRGRSKAGYRSARDVLNEAAQGYTGRQEYDVFLSHSIRDAELVLGVKATLEDYGRSVYVDWLEDPQMDRSQVTPETAEKIRQRMMSCKSLVYLHSGNSPSSKWMPWELGYFDGYRGAVAILPITATEEQSFHGQEYLGIYPWLGRGSAGLSSLDGLRVHRSRYDDKPWRDWMAAPRAFKKVA